MDKLFLKTTWGIDGVTSASLYNVPKIIAETLLQEYNCRAFGDDFAAIKGGSEGFAYRVYMMSNPDDHSVTLEFLKIRNEHLALVAALASLAMEDQHFAPVLETLDESDIKRLHQIVSTIYAGSNQVVQPEFEQSLLKAFELIVSNQADTYDYKVSVPVVPLVKQYPAAAESLKSLRTEVAARYPHMAKPAAMVCV